MIRAVIFDIGETLVNYHKPLNWSRYYRYALESMAAQCRLALSDRDYEHAIAVLSKYNTRMNPREYEVSSDTIFRELLSGEVLRASGRRADDLEECKAAFYTCFQSEASLFPETEQVLKGLASMGIAIGTLSDVAYGMDNRFALRDIADVRPYIQFPLTSNDVGYRKPSPRGVELMAAQTGAGISELLLVGNEEKDILCAKRAGAAAVLINRDPAPKAYGQDYEIKALDELFGLDILQ